MGLQCGIVGLPNVGKSTLFNALSRTKAEAANFPFCTIEPNLTTVAVPDARLGTLETLVHPQRVVPTTVEFVDIAGLVKGASQGEGLGNKFLSNIRDVDAIIHVIRCFEDPNVVHVDGRVDPLKDKEIIDTELQLKDLESVEKKFQKVEKTARAGDGAAKKELAALEYFRKLLMEGRNLREAEAGEDQRMAVEDLHLLTMKSVIYVANVDEQSLPAGGNAFSRTLQEAVAREDAQVVIISAAIESQIADLESDDDKRAFLAEYGLAESGLNKLIRASYTLLNLITFFTAGEKEVKAWTVRRGWKAPQAAGVIHSDFEKGFIKAEVIKLPDYQQYKSEAGCRDAGKIAIEGKDYVVEDGDIMHFRFNV